MNLHKCTVMSQVVDFQITYTWPDVKLSKIQRSEVAALPVERKSGRTDSRTLPPGRDWREVLNTTLTGEAFGVRLSFLALFVRYIPRSEVAALSAGRSGASRLSFAVGLVVEGGG